MTVNGNESLIRMQWAGYGQVFTVGCAVLVYLGFAVIERETFAFGGRLETAAAEIGMSVSKAGGLTPACTELASQLAEESLKTRLRENGDEEGALDAYLNWPCPVKALPGVSYGVSHTIRATYRGV